MYSKMQNASRAPLTTWRVVQAVRVDPDHLAGLDVAHALGADDVQRARLAGDAVVVADLAEHERPQPGGVAEGDERVLRHQHGRERALQARDDLGDGVLDALGLVRGQQRGDDLRVRRRAEAQALLAQLGVQLDGVDEVAVVAERELAAVGAVHGLGVVPAVGAGRRVAHMTDRDLAAERAQLLLVEDLVDETEVAQGHDVPAAICGGDAGGLLPAVLQCVQREVGEPRDFVAGSVDPEHAALVAWPLAAIEHGHSHKDSHAFGGEPIGGAMMPAAGERPDGLKRCFRGSTRTDR